METASFYSDLEFGENNPKVKLILETSSSKEIRICMKKDQEMREHKTPFPITIQILQGTIEFGAFGESTTLVAGQIVGLDGNIPHHLIAIEDSIVRLSLNKNDTSKRVADVAQN